MRGIYKVRGEKGSFGYYFFRSITEFGYFYVVILFMIIMLFLWKFNYKFWILTCGTAITSMINILTKLIVDRQRPDEAMRQVHESSSSFPSGHSITSFFFYMLLAYFIWESDSKPRTKKVCLTICISIALLVGLSRMILGVHYFTDVIGAYMLGFLCLVGVIYVERHYRNKTPKSC